MSKKHDVVIIGGGPGGYVAAIRAAQNGLNTAVVDENSVLGGTCLRVGCIPSKAMLESSHLYHMAKDGLADHGIKTKGVDLDLKAMLKRKEKVVDMLTKGIGGLMKKNKVTVYRGRGKMTGAKTVEVSGDETETLEADHVVLATGSVPATLKGVEYDGDRIGTSTEALAYTEPPKHLVVIGAGYIGLELGSVWSRLGARVTVLEYLDRVLPGLDAGIAKIAHKLLKRQGLEFELGTKVTSAKVKNNTCVIEREGADAVECDRVLVAVGRKPNTEGLGLDAAGVETDDRGFIPVDEHLQTKVEGVWAIGDVIGGAMLAHKAEEEGVAVADRIAGKAGHVNYDVIPAVVYTHPEIGAVGKTEEQLKDEGVEYTAGTFPFTANGRARTINETDGQVKILADKQTDRVLGVHIIHARAGDLIAEAAAAMEYGASAEDIAMTCHAHPTLSEAVKEAALAVHGRALHS